MSRTAETATGPKPAISHTSPSIGYPRSNVARSIRSMTLCVAARDAFRRGERPGVAVLPAPAVSACPLEVSDPSAPVASGWAARRAPALLLELDRVGMMA